MTSIKQLSYSDRNGFYQLGVIKPGSTTVKAVAVAGQTLIEAHAEHAQATRELEAARAASSRLTDEAQQDALDAGRIGKKPDTGKARKKRQAVADRLEDADLVFLASGANLGRLRIEYLGILAHHTPALSAEAKSAADAATLGLVTAVEITARAEAALAASLGMLASLPQVAAGGDFRPVAPAARRKTSDDFGQGTSPIAFASGAGEYLRLSIEYTQRVLEDLAADAKARAADDDESDELVVETDEEIAADEDDADEGDDDE